MKKYIIKDSQGNKKTIYAESLSHAIKLNDAFNLKPGDVYLTRSDETTIYKVLKIDNTAKGFNSINVTTEAYKYNVFSGKIERESGASNHSLDRNDIETVFSSMNEAIKYLQRKAKQYESFSKKIRKDSIKDEASLAEIDEAIDNIADKYGGFYSRTYDKVFKDLKAKYPTLKYEDVRQAIINYAENSSSANSQLRVAKKYFSDSVNDSRVKDEASLATTINALVNDEKSAIDSYNVAIKNLEEKIDEKAMQVLINIRNDERRHIENLYSILNGQVTEKNLEDSRMKDSKYYVGISKYDYTKEQAERDARKFGLQLKVVGKSRDPHFEYDAYFIGPRSNILKMLKANDLEEFEEDIEDSKVNDEHKFIGSPYDNIIKRAINRGKLNNPIYHDKYALRANAREGKEIVEVLKKMGYSYAKFENNPYTSYNVFFNDSEEFEEDIEDSVYDAKLKESNSVYYKLERGYWHVLSIHNAKQLDDQDVQSLARKNNVIIEPFFKHDYHRTDKGGYYFTDYRVKGKDKNAVIRFCETMNPRVKPLNFEE